MAADEPALDLQSWRGEDFSLEDNRVTESIEIGMSGMSLMASMNDPKARRGTDSTVSTSPDDREYLISRNPELSTSKGSAPSSPSGERHVGKFQGRPSGLSGPLPSPIGKPGHSKNSSASSPLLTLTPNSSVDGQAEWQHNARQSSPFPPGDAPVMPFLNASHRRGVVTEDGNFGFGSFELLDNDNDGLLGLDALRDRSYSSPGPIVGPALSTSPTSARVHFPPNNLQGSEAQVRARNASRDRPPLSQSYGEQVSHTSDRSVSGISLSSNRSADNPHNISFDSGDSRGFGAIGRAELRQSAAEFEPARRRAASTGNFQNQYVMQQQPAIPDVAQKFGSLPSLGAHIQQQRIHENLASLQKPRHVRSVSQPVPVKGSHVQQPQPVMETQYSGMSGPFPPYQPNPYFSEKVYGGVRASSGSHPALSSSYDGSTYQLKRGSLPNLTSAPGYQVDSYPVLQRRDALDFSSSGHMNGVASVNSMDEYRSFAGPSMISPGHSPHEISYGSHSRQPSDAGPVMLSSSPMSINSGNVRVHSFIERHNQGSDDDLTHPLVGEHIEVPEQDESGSYMFSHRGSHPLVRPPAHSHSLSLDQIPAQLLEVPQHLPTAGSNLLAPQVIYSVKFKRTQRNFVLGPRINRDLKIGTYVKVEADRGEDLGIVVGKVPADKYSMSGRHSFSAGMGISPTGLSTGSDLKRIIRLATHDEVSLLSIKREEEEELLKICRTKVRQRGLPMNVVDAEYQFDRHKLTFFFEAEGRVDFRELVRDLFSMYKTRIWMQQLDKNTSTSAQAIMSPMPSAFQMDYGTPIIAPVSEFADSIILNGILGGDARAH